MQSVTNDTFGPLVAYLVPGATVLLGLRPYFPLLDRWFAATPADAPTLGGFLYLTVASLAAGMTVSAIRWATVDRVHARTGVRPPPLDFAMLRGSVDGYALLIEIHYRHYQFYANMLVATAIGYFARRLSADMAAPVGWLDAAVVLLEVVFFLTSRDTLRKYYARSEQLLSGKRPSPRR